MKKANTTHTLKRAASALLMLAALLWLTVSTPFVYACQQQVAAAQKEGAKKTTHSTNPLSNTNEEKPESGANSVSEYLHQAAAAVQVAPPLVKYEKCHAPNLYLAFHPELLCPPPNNLG